MKKRNTSSRPSAAPRVATPRTDRPTWAAGVEEIAKQLGLKLMPWQRQVLEVALEHEDDVPAYREVVVSVPRQSGKSVLLLLAMLRVCLLQPDRLAVYTAQTGWDARRKVLEDFWPLIRRSPLARMVKRVYRGAADAAIIWTTGSRLEHMASAERAGHGRIVDIAAIDEAWADIDDRREASLLPTMATRAAAQLWVASTAGTQESIYWARKVAAGRDAAASGRTEGLCYFEWSAPDGADPDDEEMWWQVHPALGHTVRDVRVLRHARASMTEAEFTRAFLNRPTDSVDDRVVPAAAWEALCSNEARPTPPLRFAADAMPDRSRAAIVVFGGGVVELVEARDGVTWLLEELRALVERHGGEVVLDGGGPLSSLAAELERAGVRVRALTTGEVCDAAGRTMDAVIEGKIRVRTSSVLSAAAAAVRRRPVGDRWLWSRRASSEDVSPFVAMSLAVGAPEQVRVPVRLMSLEEE